MPSLDLDLPHHPVVLMLQDVTVVHEDTWFGEVEENSDLFTGIHKNGILPAPFLYCRRFAVP